MQKGVSVHRICQCINALSPLLGSDIVQWMIKNLDIEDQGKKIHIYMTKIDVRRIFNERGEIGAHSV